MPFDPTRPFTTAQARDAGISKRRLAGPEYRRLLTGAWISSRVAPHPGHRAEAALLFHPSGAVATYTSAARVLGAPVPRSDLEHVTVPRRGDRRPRLGVRCHVAALDATETRVVRGVRISAPERMFVELASLLDLVDLVVVGDWLVRQRYTSPESLRSYCRSASAAARRAARYVRAGADSPMETRLRMLIVLAGLPEPEVNMELRDEHGFVVRRLDLAYRGARLAVEYDGRHHLNDPAQWESDHGRRDDLEHDGWKLLVVTSRGIYREPERTIERIRRALEQRGRHRVRSTDGWRQYFAA